MIELLIKGNTVLIDDIDSDLSEYNWFIDRRADKRTAYVLRKITVLHKKKCLRMHRVILERMLGRSLTSGETVDHINCNGLDNRRSNLRPATSSQQTANTKKARSSSGVAYSNYKGVTWYKHIHKWAAKIQHEGKDKHLGVFEQEIDAAKAYDEAALKYFGEFAKLNFS